MVDFQKRRIEYTDLGHQVLRENQTRPCREANHYSGRHHNTPILIPCLQRHFYRVTDCAVIINKSPVIWPPAELAGKGNVSVSKGRIILRGTSWPSTMTSITLIWIGLGFSAIRFRPSRRHFTFGAASSGIRRIFAGRQNSLIRVFTAISSEFVALLLADGGIFLIFSQKTDSRSSGNDTPLVWIMRNIFLAKVLIVILAE